MILVDTSVWIDHLARGDAQLETLLEDGGVLIHPFIVAEIALGSLRRREETLGALQALPHVPVAQHQEVMSFLESEGRLALGIGYVDLHLLAATRLAPGSKLWTRPTAPSARSETGCGHIRGALSLFPRIRSGRHVNR